MNRMEFTCVEDDNPISFNNISKENFNDLILQMNILLASYKLDGATATKYTLTTFVVSNSDVEKSKERCVMVEGYITCIHCYHSRTVSKNFNHQKQFDLKGEKPEFGQ